MLQITGNEGSNQQESSQTDSEEDQPTRTVSMQISNQQGMANKQASLSEGTRKKQVGPPMETDKKQATPSNYKRTRIRQLHSVVQDMKSLSENLYKEEESNEFDIFGNYVGIQLKSLLEEDAVIAQEQIQSILTRYKLKKIRLKSKSESESSQQRNQSRLSDYQSFVSPTDSHVNIEDTTSISSQSPQYETDIYVNKENAQNLNLFPIEAQNMDFQPFNIIDVAFENS